MAINLGPQEYKGYQRAGGKRNNSGPVGPKAKPSRLYRKAQAAQANLYWTRIGRAVHGVTYPVRLVYWT